MGKNHASNFLSSTSLSAPFEKRRAYSRAGLWIAWALPQAICNALCIGDENLEEIIARITGPVIVERYEPHTVQQ